MLFNIEKNKNKIKFYGRTLFLEKGVTAYYSAAGIEFNAKISGAISLTAFAENIDYSKSGGVYFNVYINDKLNKRIHLLSNKKQEFILAENLEGEYNIKVIRETEFAYGMAYFNDLNFNGEFLQKPKNKDLYIEFIGDSITCGYGLLYKGQKSLENNKPSIESATKAYAYKTAKTLNADYSLISQSGIGAYIGYVTTYNMSDIYPYFAKRYSNKKYNFKRSPNIIVLNLGTNDVGANDDIYKKSLEEIYAGFKKLLLLVRKHNKKSKIVWCYGMMRNEFNELIIKLINESGGSEKGYYAFHLPRNNDGFRWHPNTVGQSNAAKSLSEFLKTI